MEVRLHRPERTPGLARDLVERCLGEEPQRDDFPVRLGERRDRGPDLRRPLGTDRQDRRIGQRGGGDGLALRGPISARTLPPRRDSCRAGRAR